MRRLLLLAGCLLVRAASAQVGIGTPSTDAALDVTSTTKGLLLPRLADVIGYKDWASG